MRTNLGRILVVCTSALFVLNSITAQVTPEEFGKISPELLKMKYYDKDPQADAVILSDVANTRFVPLDGTFDVVFERTTRIKIFKQSAFDVAEIVIPYYFEGNNIEKVSGIKAITYNLNGEQIETTVVGDDDIFEEKINQYWKSKKFALPNVREGSVIEYKYVISSPFVMKLRDWEFQNRIPTEYSNYAVRMIPFYEYQWVLQGAKRFSSQKDWVDDFHEKSFVGVKYKEYVHEYTMVDIPAFKSEDYISSRNDYIIKIDFQLHKINTTSGGSIKVVESWPALIKELDTNESFGKYADKAEKSASKIIDIRSMIGKTEAERFDVIVKSVKRNYNWNEYPGKYANDNLNKFLEIKTGNTGNLNLALVGLLNAAGIEAYPVILSTRDNGKIKDIPFLDFFNYVIVAARINGSYLFADASETFTSSAELPVRCLNEKGLLVKRDTVKWVSIEPLTPSIIKSDINIRFTKSCDTILATIKTQATGYEALALRKRYYNETEKITADCAATEYYVETDSISIENMTVPDSTLVISFPFTTESERIGNRLIISPFLKEPVSNNRLTEQTRSYPVDFIYPDKHQFSSKIILPQNSKIISLPAKATISNNEFSLMYEIVTTDKEITVTGEYFFKKSIYKPADYSKIKFYFSELIKVMNSQIVIEIE